MSYETPDKLEDLFSHRYSSFLFKMGEQNRSLRSLSYRLDGQEKTINYVLLDPNSNWRSGIQDGSTNRVVYLDLSQIVDLAVENKVTGFGYGNIHLIVPANVPEEFIRYVLYHEITDSHFLGVATSENRDLAARRKHDNTNEADRAFDRDMAFAQEYAHTKGCQIELCQVFYEGEEFARRYSEWLLEMNGDPENQLTYFNKAIPGFLKRNGRLDKKPLGVVIEFFLAIHNYSGTESRKKDIVDHWLWIKSHLPEHPPEDRVFI